MISCNASAAIGSVAAFPGTKKMRPTLGFSRTFINVSARRFPGHSGTARVLWSRTLTKPGASPLREISIRLEKAERVGQKERAVERQHRHVAALSPPEDD